MDKPLKIDNHTLIPIGIAASIAMTLLSAAASFFLTTNRYETGQAVLTVKLDELDKRTTRIEAKLDSFRSSNISLTKRP